ncbi:kinase-like domain-containing protein [Paraphysoderma sedebokerense]|nr:kinase-like domain-containing protein [Paraphysoderma sedebokerense]
MESIGKSAVEGKDDKSDFFSPLEHEIDLWKNIHHPHLLELKDVITTPEAMFIFSEYVTDGNLLTLVNEWDRICFSTPIHGDKDVASDGILDIGAEWIKIARSISSQGQLDIDSTALDEIDLEQIQGSTGNSLSPKPPKSSQKKLLPSHIRHRQKSQQTVRLTRSQSVSLESLDAFKSRRSNGSPKASAPTSFPSVNSSSSLHSASSKSRHTRTTLGLPESFARSIFSQLSAAIKYLHDEVGILHRDLKLENVLCSFEWVIVSVYIDQNGNEIDPLEILNLLPPLSPISTSNVPPYNCNIDTTKLRKVLKRKLLKVHVKLCDFGLSDWIEPTKQKLVELVLNMRGEPLPTPTTSSFTTSNPDAQESELQMVRNNPMYTTHHYLGNLLPANNPTCSIPSKSNSSKACTGSKYVHEAMGSLEYCSPEELAPDCVLVERNSPYSLMNPSSIQDSMNLLSSPDHPSVVTSPSQASIAALEKLVTRYLTSSEIWSLGVILYALLTGMMPFQAEFEPRLVKLIREGKYNPLPICEIDETDKEGLQWIKDIVGCVPEENLGELFSIIYEADCGMKGSKVNDELSLSSSSNGMKKLKASQLETVMETTEEYRTTPSHSRNPSLTIGKSNGIVNGATNSLNQDSSVPPTKRKVTKLPPPSLLHFRDHDGKVTEEAAKVLSGCFAIDWRTRWNCETIEKCEWFKV